MKKTIPLKRIHFIGIGGIGMSAIAEMLDDLGLNVQGSDAKESANTERVRKSGIPVFIGHHADNLAGVDAVVVSTAIQPDNPELVAAKKMGIPVGHRSEMLAEILRFKQSICISGTHGKTTTSSMIASVLMAAKMHPSFVIGGILNSLGANARLGKGKYVVVEADESDGSFLKLPHAVSVVTNIDPEHMDFYKDFNTMKQAYRLFVDSTSFYGFTILNTDHPVVKEMADSVSERQKITYGLNKAADVHADHIRVKKGRLVFDVFVRRGAKFTKIKDVTLNMLGLHNVQNALAAFAVGTGLGVKDDVIKKALKKFKGIQRRLTLRGKVKGVSVYDDYGHHPVEIGATLSAVRSAAPAKVVAIFQPHRYSRLKDLWNEFLTCFKEADTVVVCDVFSAGEQPIEGINKETFAEALSKIHPDVRILDGFDSLAPMIQKMTASKDTVVCLGAGSISSESVKLVKALKGKNK
ncbi:MAG: UDP-N-acetylmuramate--L-alanine ligase [Alphaproteobacteria bacterium]|nr:UDP-N-acetylmuramate--L-alanine ligase [Alphaproteobacteria bacterium]